MDTKCNELVAIVKSLLHRAVLSRQTVEEIAKCLEKNH